MIKLSLQSNVKPARPGEVNLRPHDSVPNFAPPRNVVSHGFLANLKYLLTERGVKIPADARGSAFHPHHLRHGFLDNLKEFFRPAPKISGDAVNSFRSGSPGIKIESQPLYLSIFGHIRDIIVPPKLPPLELTSKPVEVPEIWSKHRKLSAANVVSAVLHVSFIILVLVFTVRQVTSVDPVKPVTVLIAPPIASPAAGPPPPPASAPAPTVSHRATLTKRNSFFVHGKLTAPVAIPKVVSSKRSTDDAGAADPNLGGVPGGVAGGVPGGVPGGQPGGVLGGILGGVPGGPAAPAAPTPKPGIMRVGGNVRRPREIYAPAPEYPAAARRVNIQGVVVVDAVIDEHGNVVKLHAVSGIGLLTGAALKAVAQWKYEPTYLDGVPIPVEMEVEVRFNLNQP